MKSKIRQGEKERRGEEGGKREASKESPREGRDAINK